MQWRGWQTDKSPAFYGGVLFFVLAVSLLVWGGFKTADWVQDQQNSPIRQVRLYGNFQHIKAGELHQRLQQQYVGNFFRVDVDQVQQFLQQQPWVYQVAVRKQWPDTLVVVVTEQKPAAIWNEQHLLNTRGELFTAPLEQLIPQLPKLQGPEGSEQDALDMFRNMQKLLTLSQFRISRVLLTERFSWQLQLENGVALKLGREDTLKRVQRFIELYPTITGYKTEAVAEVDLRYDTGIAVRYTTAEEKRKA